MREARATADRAPRLALGLLVAACALGACGDGEGDAVAPDASAGGADAASAVCTVVAPTECPDPMPVYGDVAPIIESRCLGCHDGTTDNWPLTTYPHVAAWYAEIRTEMLNCTMPPPEENIPMTTAERERILQWIRCGYPDGSSDM